jgi:hypothetical protein
MERGRRHNDVERLGRLRPVLEPGGDDLDLGKAGEVAPGDCRQLNAQLDSDDMAAALGQRHGGLPGPWADLQHPAAWADPRQLRQVLEQRRRVAWPRPVVQLGGLVEGSSQSRAVGARHAKECAAVERARDARGQTDRRGAARAGGGLLHPPPGIHQHAQPAPALDAVAAHTVAIETCERYLQS